jgi:hypothetical protein
MRLFPSGHFHDFLDRRDEKFIHLPAYLVVRYIDSGAVKVGAYGFKNLARAVFLDFGSDEAACVTFRGRAGLAKFSSGPKSSLLLRRALALNFSSSSWASFASKACSRSSKVVMIPPWHCCVSAFKQQL